MLLLPKIIYVASQKFNITSPFMLSINELSINLVLCNSLTIQQSLFSKNTQIRAETFLFFSLHLIRIYLVIFFLYTYIYIYISLFIICLINFLYPIHLIVYLSVYLFFLSFAFFFLVVVIAFFVFSCY